MKKFIIIGLLFGLIMNAQEYFNMRPVWVKAAPDSTDWFGGKASFGDFNGDGYRDALFWAHLPSGNYKLYLFYGNSSGIFDTIPDLTFTGAGFGAFFTAGDINADGYDDIIASVAPVTNYGIQYIFFGSDTMDNICDMVLDSVGMVPSIGDINGDGYADLVVGDEGKEVDGVDDCGEIRVYYGGPLLDTIPDIKIEGTWWNSPWGPMGEQLGTDIAAGRDINNDGYDDIVAGAALYKGVIGNYAYYVYYGGNPMDTLPDAVLTIYNNGELGTLTEAPQDFAVGDINGDGYDDVVVGYLERLTFSVEGIYMDTVVVWYGGNPMDEEPDIIFSNKDGIRSEYKNWFGYSTCGIDTSDGDRYCDIGVGAPLFLADTSAGGIVYGPGAAFLYTGGYAPDTFPDGYTIGADTVDTFAIGDFVKSAGDIDNDGRDEIMISNYAGRASPYTGSPIKVWICKYTGPSGFESVRKPVKLNFQVESVSPNPFLNETEIVYNLPFKGKVSINVYDELGRMVDRCIYGKKDAGRHRIRWGKGMKKGVYFIRIEAETHSEIIIKTIKAVKL